MGYFNEGRNRFGALILILLGAVLAGCDEKGGKTTDTDSAGFTTLAEKKAFLEQYVTFRRNYEELDFDISFIDGGDGRVPGPTEWDVRVRAKVPSTDLADWVSGMTMTVLKPIEAPTSARPMPVLPAVPSTIVPPGRRSPRATASRMM